MRLTPRRPGGRTFAPCRPAPLRCGLGGRVCEYRQCAPTSLERRGGWASRERPAAGTKAAGRPFRSSWRCTLRSPPSHDTHTSRWRPAATSLISSQHRSPLTAGGRRGMLPGERDLSWCSTRSRPAVGVTSVIRLYTGIRITADQVERAPAFSRPVSGRNEISAISGPFSRPVMCGDVR